MSQICTKAGDYFRPSKPHSGKLWNAFKTQLFTWGNGDQHWLLLVTLMGISRVFLRRPLNSLQLILVPHFFYIRQSCIVLVSKRKWFIKVSGAICNPHWSFSLSLTLWVQVLLCGKMNYKGPFGLEINCAEYCLFITNSYESQRTEPSPGTAGHC